MQPNSELLLQLIGPALGAASLIYVTRMGIKQKRIENAAIKAAQEELKKQNDSDNQDENIADQVKGFHKTLLEMLKLKQAEAEAFQSQILTLNERIATLTEKFNSVKNGVMTMDMMGDNSPIAFWIKDREGNRIYHNKAYQDMTGWDIDDCFGKTDFEITKDRVLSDNWKAVDDKVITTGQAVMAIELCCHVDRPGEYFEVLTFKWPKLYKTRETESVIGVEGAAIRVDQIEETFSQAA